MNTTENESTKLGCTYALAAGVGRQESLEVAVLDFNTQVYSHFLQNVPHQLLADLSLKLRGLQEAFPYWVHLRCEVSPQPGKALVFTFQLGKLEGALPTDMLLPTADRTIEC